MKHLWTPESALQRMEHTRIGGYHIVVRREEVKAVEEATYAGIKKACDMGKLAGNPTITGLWPGWLWLYPDELSSSWATIYMLQAPRMCNLPTDALSSFETDAKRLSPTSKRGVLPIMVVTEISHTRRWKNLEGKVVDTDYFDPHGPDTVKALALEGGVTVLRTTQEALPTMVQKTMIELHTGQTPTCLITP